MFWPLILPFKITLWTLFFVVAVATALAPLLKWKRGKAFFVSSALAVVAFIPSCMGVMYVVDQMRFGYFEYRTFDDVKDFRAERWLPTSASHIKMHKHANGYLAQYNISNADFHAYLDNLWKKYGQFSSAKRGGRFGEGSPASREEMDRWFSELGWKPLTGAIEDHSPREADGGGATYYFDSSVGVAYQRTGYW